MVRVEQFSPTFIVATAAYVIYAYCYKFAWHTVDDHGKGGGLIAGFCVLLLLMGSCWVSLVIVGPGFVETSEASDLDYYMSDAYGYRQYCSHCQQLKPDRAHHTSQLNRCVPKMDHYCSWLSSVIGLGNYKMFLQFLFYVLLLFFYVIITVASFVHAPQKKTSAQLWVLYGISIMWTLLLISFFGLHFYFLLLDRTTIEHLDVKRNAPPIYNIGMPDGTRVVTRIQKGDRPYSRGMWKNFTLVMSANPIYWFLPVPVHVDSYNEMTPQFLEVLRERYRTGKEGYLAERQYNRPPPMHTTPAIDGPRP
uniref:Palmitoyltransferase n=1 Tax=Blastobotrys adeninivorans TaxID=409370 RepID=A0A060T827_BLAAD